MPGYRSEPSRPDKAKAIAGVIVVYAVIIGAALLMPANSPLRMGEQPQTVLVDVNEIPEPQPPPKKEPGKAKEEEGAAGKKAEPTEVVVPEPKQVVPAKSPVAAAPIAGTGSASTAGAATAGTGPGAGGSGTGSGGGGTGGGGSQAQWISGGLQNSDYPRAALHDKLQGRVSVRFTVLVSGRIAKCRITASSGSPLLDATTCRLLTERLRFRPATNGAGVPVQSELGSDYTWGINFRRY
ncbi:MAG TPA: energy transducer TonB [Sphingomicrobium sp.]|jgi:protein TonB|nr:energy transducer TonB [Sphingomicrobium sp.]